MSELAQFPTPAMATRIFSMALLSLLRVVREGLLITSFGGQHAVNPREVQLDTLGRVLHDTARVGIELFVMGAGTNFGQAGNEIATTTLEQPDP